MTAPKRIQLRRTKGWRLPDGAINVARPSRWGNPYKVGVYGAAVALVAVNAPSYADAIIAGHIAPWYAIVIIDSIDKLRGHDLACWCPLDQPCHADVLIELANRSDHMPEVRR